jgi:hypothetical protein
VFEFTLLARTALRLLRASQARQERLSFKQNHLQKTVTEKKNLYALTKKHRYKKPPSIAEGRFLSLYFLLSTFYFVLVILLHFAHVS